jgi:hypothetical protein
MESEPLTEFLKLVPPLLYVAGGLGSWKVIYEITKTADDVLSEDVKKNISNRLEKLNPSGAIAGWPEDCIKVFNAIFGSRHFSLRCILMSWVSSLLAVALFTAFYVASRPLFGPASIIIKASSWFLVLNWVFDYVALFGNRLMLRFMAKSRGPSLVLWMLLSFLITFVIATNAALNIAFMIAMFLAGTFLDPISWVLTLTANFKVFLPALPAAILMQIPAGIFFWSTFCIWFWILLYALAEMVLTSAKWAESLRGYLDFRNKPVATIGFVMGGMAVSTWWVSCLLKWVLK